MIYSLSLSCGYVSHRSLHEFYVYTVLGSVQCCCSLAAESHVIISYETRQCQVVVQSFNSRSVRNVNSRSLKKRPHKSASYHVVPDYL